MDIESLAVRFTTEGEAELRGALMGVAESANFLHEKFGELAAAFLTYEAWEQAIEKNVELAVSLERLAQKTGIAVDELSRLQYAASLSLVSSDELDTGLKFLTRSIQAAGSGAGKQAESFKLLKIDVSESAMAHKTLDEVLGEVATKFESYADGPAKGALALNLFGRSGLSIIPFLNQGAEGIKKLGEESDRLGNTMTVQQKEVFIKYEESMKRLNASTAGLWRSFAMQLTPALTDLSTAMLEARTAQDQFISAMDVAVAAGRVLGGTLIMLETFAKVIWHAFKDSFILIGNGIGGLAAIWSLMLEGSFDQANIAAKQWKQGLAADSATMDKDIKNDVASAETALKRLYGLLDEEDEHPKDKNKAKAKAPRLASAAPVDDGLWKAQIKAAADAYEVFKIQIERQIALSKGWYDIQIELAEKLVLETIYTYGVGTKEYEEALKARERIEIEKHDYLESLRKKWRGQKIGQDEKDFNDEQAQIQRLITQTASIVQKTMSAAFSGGGIGGTIKAFGKAMLGELGAIFVAMGEKMLMGAEIFAQLRVALANWMTAPWAIAAGGLLLVALGASMQAIAGGGGGGSGGGGGGSPFFGGPTGGNAFGSGPTQLIFGQQTNEVAAGMTPKTPVNVTIIGPNDPVAQRGILELIQKANAR
jgi:hypothetical protein